MLRTPDVALAIAVCTAITLAPPHANAGELLYSVHTGFGLPWTPDEFRTSSQRGLQLGAGLGLRLDATLSIASTVQVHNYELDTKEFLRSLGLSPEGLDVAGGDVTLFTFFTDLRRAFDGPRPGVRPYVAAGAGYLWFSRSARDLIDLAAGGVVEGRQNAASSNGPAWSVSAGVEWVVLETAAFVAETRLEGAFVPGDNITTTSLKLGLAWR